VVEVLLMMTVSAGFPAALNGVEAARKGFQEEDTFVRGEKNG
jgi:hypothetical protein